MIRWWATEFGEPEIANVAAAIHGGRISQGKITREFEEALAERLGVPYVTCTTSGTTALTMALMACGVGHGDEVIVPDKTWIASAHAVMMIGATVRLCDTCADGPVMGNTTPALSAATKATMPVNFNGRMAGIPAIGVSHVEDSCQAFPQPPRSDIACYSLSTAKLIATGQGGFCATRNESLYKELLALRTHDISDAMVPEALTWRRFGYNFRFTDIQAAIGLAQLERLPWRIERLREINALYLEYLSQDMRPMPHAAGEIPLYNEILLPSLQTQEELRSHLMDRGIQCRPFYPLLHTAPYLNATGTFPNAERFAHGLILPSGPNQANNDILTVCRTIESYRWVG